MLSKLRTLLVCTLALCSVPALLPAQTFTNPYRIPTPNDPYALTVGDFNGDGHPDIAWVDTSTSPATLHLLLAQGNGSFLPVPTLITFPPIATTRFPACLTADFNHDGHQDLACSGADQFNTSVLVFLGNGDGTFQSPISTPVPTQNNAVWASPTLFPAGDLNGDGLTDLIIIDAQSLETLVLLGDGKGSFRSAIHIQSGYSFPAPTIADINGDGKPDILWPNGPEVELGNGDGSFGPLMNYSAKPYNIALCTFHDMDRDGHLDAVCGYAETSNGDTSGNTDLIILHGNPDGSFNTTPIAQKTFGTKDTALDGFGTFDYPVAVADLNGDGIPDVLASSGDGLAVLLGGPGLTFTVPLHYAAAEVGYGSGLVSLYESQIIDMNGDAIPDIVAAGPNGLYISYGRKDGSFTSAFAPEVTEVIGYPTVADFNGDGIPDIAATGDTAIKLSLGKGDGTFSAPTALSNNNGAINFSAPLSPTNAHILHGDFNGDGKLDILAIGSSSIYQNDPYILFGHGDGTFDAPRVVPNTSTVVPMFPQLADDAVFDINHDGRSDILSSNTTLGLSAPSAQIYFSLSNGDGSFRTVSTTVPSDLLQGTFDYVTFPALADFNHDGKLDAAYGSLTNAYVVNGHGDGTFDTTSTPLPIPSISGVTSVETLSVTTGDFDGDGNQDFAVLADYYGTPTAPGNHPLSTAAWIFYGNGNSTFSAPVLAATFNHNFTNIAAADLNNDGLADIVVKTSGSNGGGYAVGVLTSQPGRTFGPEVNYTAGTGLSSLAITDVNRDGLPDLIFGNGDFNVIASSVTVLLNQSSAVSIATTTTLTCTPSTIPIGGTSLLSAAVTATSGTPTGSIHFTDNTASLGQPALTNGDASLTYTGQLAGTHTLLATYVPTGSFSASSASCTINVTAPVITPAITLTSSLNPAPALTPITFTAQVPAGSGGTIVFALNGQSITTTPNSAGTSTTTISTLTPGSYPVTATWFAPHSALSAQASLTQVITAAAAAPDFSLTGPDITFHVTQPATGTLTLTSLNGFTGSVSITCNTPYPPNYTCTLQQPTVALTPGLSAPITYTLTPTYTASTHPTTHSTRVVLASLFPLTLLSLLGLSRKRRTTLRALLTLTLLAILAGSTTACGPDHFIAIHPGTFPLHFTATGTNQGSSTPTTHTLIIKLIITP